MAKAAITFQLFPSSCTALLASSSLTAPVVLPCNAMESIFIIIYDYDSVTNLIFNY